jgi:hypothetical protein
MANKTAAIIAFSFAFLMDSFANAATQSACARKFIGRWIWHGPTATTTMDIQANGEMPCSNHPACVRGSGAWSCSGNQLIYNNGMYDTVLTLQGNGNVMTGHGGLGNGLQTVVREGAPNNDPAPKNMTASTSQLSHQSSVPSKPQPSKLASTQGIQTGPAKPSVSGRVVDAGTLRAQRAAQPSPSAASSCPPLAPAGPWQGSNAAYCANANCVERGSAYYGSMCFPPNQLPQQNGSSNASGASQPLTSDQQARAGKAWTTIQDASQNASPSQRRAAVGAAIAQLLQKDAELLNLIPDLLNCPGDSASDQQVRFFKCINEQVPGIEEGDASQPPPPPVSKPQATAMQDQPTPMVTIDPKNKWCQIDYGAPPGAGIQICWLEASNGYCMKWRETPDGKKLPSDFDPADQQSFSDNVANAGLYTQHCPREADDKWILYWTPKKGR